MFFIPKNTKGFTLIEMIIYISIMVIIVVVISAFIPQLVRNNLHIQARGEVLENTKNALDTIALEIRHATNIYTPTSVLDSSPGQLSLETVRNIIATEDSTFVDFFVDDGRLYVKREEQDAQIITSEKVKIDDFTITHLNSTETYQAVRISIAASFESSSTEVQERSAVTLTTMTSLRQF